MIAPSKDNLRFWESLEKTDKGYTKNFKRSGGFSGTDINPAYRMRRMTETFGPCGQGWGWTIHERWRESFEDQDVVFVSVSLWYVDGGQRYETGQQIGGTVADRTPDESYKMAITDACGKCYLSLGLAADVYMGEFDGKYHRTRNDGGGGDGSGNAPPRQQQSTKPPCPNCHKPDFVLQDRDDPAKFFCWKNEAKNKLGCGHRWSTATDSAPPSTTPPGFVPPEETHPKTIQDIVGCITRAGTHQGCNDVANLIESRWAGGYLAKKDYDHVCELLTKHQAILNTKEPQTAGAGF